MAKRYTPEQRKRLLQNPNVLRVGKHVSFKPEFKLQAVQAYLHDKKTPEQIFLEAGFVLDDVNRNRTARHLLNWRKVYERYGEAGLLNERRGVRPRNPEDDVKLPADKTDEQLVKHLSAQIKFLQQENEFLKKVFSIEGSVVDKPSTKYELIRDLMTAGGREAGCTVDGLCQIAGVSRSGYYRWLNAEEARIDRELDDFTAYLLIREIFERGNRKFGFRRIKMILERQYGIIMNHKKIRRIMRQFGLVAQIRRMNRKRMYYLATQEHRIASYRLGREFHQAIPHRVFCTDITYLHDANGRRYYLSVLLDLATGEIVAHQLLTRMTLDLSLVLIDKAVARLGEDVLDGAMINSDQGIHYANRQYASKIAELGIVQSMSRRGNCADNAPVESFFGHMKDELDLSYCQTLEDVQAAIDSHMQYHNYERYQWARNRMAPAEYREHLLAA